MEVGLLHLHRTLGYVVFFVALLDVVLILTKARTDARVARVLGVAHNAGLLMAGRLNMLLGLALWVLLPQWTAATWWIWVSLLLWGPIEVVSKRMVKPEIALAKDGGTASSTLMAGAVIELVIIVGIFGLMSARP